VISDGPKAARSFQEVVQLGLQLAVAGAVATRRTDADTGCGVQNAVTDVDAAAGAAVPAHRSPPRAAGGGGGHRVFAVGGRRLQKHLGGVRLRLRYVTVMADGASRRRRPQRRRACETASPAVAGKPPNNTVETETTANVNRLVSFPQNWLTQPMAKTLDAKRLCYYQMGPPFDSGVVSQRPISNSTTSRNAHYAMIVAYLSSMVVGHSTQRLFGCIISRMEYGENVFLTTRRT